VQEEEHAKEMDCRRREVPRKSEGGQSMGRTIEYGYDGNGNL
jgi:hypothetical protein